MSLDESSIVKFKLIVVTVRKVTFCLKLWEKLIASKARRVENRENDSDGLKLTVWVASVPGYTEDILPKFSNIYLLQMKKN